MRVMRVDDIDPLACLSKIETLIDEHAVAKGNRVGLEEMRKVTKAREMQAASDAGIKAIAAQERDAYASKQYIEIVQGLEAAVITEEKLRWQLNAEMTKIEVWRSMNADKRTATKY